jgi:hypothetical protein
MNNFIFLSEYLFFCLTDLYIYEWTGGGIAGFLGLSLVVVAIVYYRRRRNMRRRETDAPLIGNQRQVGYGGADIHNVEASDSDNDEDRPLVHPVQVSESEDNCSGDENYFPAPSPKQAVEHMQS